MTKTEGVFKKINNIGKIKLSVVTIPLKQSCSNCENVTQMSDQQLDKPVRSS